jgi:AraC family transcriptional activator FtrA
VQPDDLYVDNGQLITAAGSAAGLDMLLHLVRRDYGAKVGNQVAQRLVVAPHREGGQAQFLPRPMAQGEQGGCRA